MMAPNCLLIPPKRSRILGIPRTHGDIRNP